MAGESIYSLVTPERDELVPHYLRSSTGSCHDFCKFGREHSKRRKPFRKGIWKPFPYESSPVLILMSAGKKEEVVSVGKKKGNVISVGRKKEEVVSDGRKKEEAVDQTDTKDQSSYKKPSSDTKSCLAKPKKSLDKEKTKMHKPPTYAKIHSPSVPSSHNKPTRRKHELSSTTKPRSSKQNDSSGNRTLLLKREPSPAKKSPSADPPEIVESVFFPYTEVADSVRQGSRNVKKTAYVALHHSIPVQLKRVKVKPSSSSDDSDGMHGKGRRTNRNAETGRKLMTSREPAKRTSAPPTLMSKLSSNKTAHIKLSKTGNLKTVSSPKGQSRVRRFNGEKVSEKTFHVIRVESGNNVSSPPSPPLAKPSSYRKSSSLSSHEEDISEFKESGVEASMKQIKKKTVRKTRILVPEDKHASPKKVRFGPGKVLDVKSDNNTPRNLRFRRARVLGSEDIRGDLSRKTSKKAGVIGDTAVTGHSSEKVVLKHQNVQGKKGDQGLLNNVIEETASKLAVSRKGKVKALVGAFETVISLQEIKPSTQFVN